MGIGSQGLGGQGFWIRRGLPAGLALGLSLYGKRLEGILHFLSRKVLETGFPMNCRLFSGMYRLKARILVLLCFIKMMMKNFLPFFSLFFFEEFHVFIYFHI